jgi:hypothetical protein
MNKAWLDKTLRIRLPIVLVFVILSYIAAFYISAPERTGVGNAPKQPIPFSHKLHAGEMKIDCRFCHVGVDKGRHAMVPAANICMNCHSSIEKKSPALDTLKRYFESGESIPWQRIYRTPDYVFFDHSVHIAKGFNCSQCHGDVAKLDTNKQVKRITMGKCIDCHRGAHDEQPGISHKDVGPTNCSACHR